MSGFDPLAAATARAVAGAQLAIETATLNLGVSAGAIQAQIQTGDLIEAIVLPPQNGSDRLSIFGKTIDAQLPPGVHPGAPLVLEVTGFSGQQIFVRNLGPADPLRPLPTVFIELPAERVASLPPSPVAQDDRAPSAALPLTVARTAEVRSPPTGGPVAPPREVFVAASVRPSAAAVPIASKTLDVRTLEPKPFDLRVPQSRTPALLDPVREPLRTAQPGSNVAALARLRVPVLPVTLAAVRLMNDAARHVSAAYARLDATLAKLPLADARLGSLRALINFTGRIDLAKGETLPEQLSAFVSHVVDGTENKLAQLVRLLAPAPDAQPESPAARSSAHAPEPASAPAATVSRDVPLPVAPEAAAQAVERTVAVSGELKVVMLSLLHDAPRGMTAPLAQAIGNAIAATTALQLNVLEAKTADPGSISIPLPAYFYEGGKPAQLRISRDPKNAGARMDGDNFSVSFVLDTKTLGTVAIDVRTASRAVTIDVKTERAAAAHRFRETLPQLRGRLEELRYRVASVAADVVRAAAPPPAPALRRSTDANVDLRA